MGKEFKETLSPVELSISINKLIELLKGQVDVNDLCDFFCEWRKNLRKKVGNAEWIEENISRAFEEDIKSAIFPDNSEGTIDEDNQRIELGIHMALVEIVEIIDVCGVPGLSPQRCLQNAMYETAFDCDEE